MKTGPKQLLAIASLILAGLLVRSIAHAQGFFRVAPGPLNEGHAAYDNSDGCSKCHESSRGVTNQKCSSCHKTTVHAGGLHVTFGNRNCSSCHTEHKGRAYSIIDWQSVGGRDGFKHEMTGFSLTEHHSQVACTKCHVRRLKTGRVSFVASSKECQSCHASAHGFKRADLSKNCEICHKPGQSLRGQLLQGWQTEHLKYSKVKLEGLHANQRCVRCHENAQIGARGAPRSCIDCHTPDHPVSDKTKNCLDCHDQNATFKGTKFNHGKLGFALTGRHATARCASCHPKGDRKGPGRVPSPACASCHAPGHPTVPATANCVSCHESGGSFKGAQIDHSQFGFPRLGMHAQLTCTRCHESNTKLEYREGECAKCHAHKSAHAGQFKDKPCTACHVEGGTRNGPFNHDLDAGFALIGYHGETKLRNDCERCHPGRVYRTRKYECVDCHADQHNGELGKKCAQCHSPFVQFDKPRTDGFLHSRFELEGKHKTLACNACHGKHQYKLNKQRCFDCHQKDDKHKGKLGQDCGKCHRPVKGAPKFDHNTMTRFIKNGTHRRVACALCHQPNTTLAHPPSIAEWKQTPVGKLDLSFPVRGHLCSECHADPHAAAFGSNCETCHSTSGFKRIGSAAKSTRPSDHAGAWIRRHSALANSDDESAPVKSTCAACHGTPGCRNCHHNRAPPSHTALFRIRTHGAIASFDPTACSTCHQAASCTQCHRRTPPLNHRGAWRTLHGYAAGGFADNNCFICHRRADCALCHRTH